MYIELDENKTTRHSLWIQTNLINMDRKPTTSELRFMQVRSGTDECYLGRVCTVLQ